MTHELNFSFETLRGKIQSNCMKIDYLLKNFNSIMEELKKKKNYETKEILSLKNISQFNMISYHQVNNLMLFDKLNDLIELYFLTEEILNNFVDFMFNDNMKIIFITDFYENINLLLSEYRFYKTYNLIVDDYYDDNNNRYREPNIKKYDEFFNYSDLKSLI